MKNLGKEVSQEDISVALAFEISHLQQIDLQKLAGLDENNQKRYFSNLQEKVNRIHNITKEKGSLIDAKKLKEFNKAINKFLMLDNGKVEDDIKDKGYELEAQAIVTLIKNLPKSIVDGIRTRSLT